MQTEARASLKNEGFCPGMKGKGFIATKVAGGSSFENPRGLSKDQVREFFVQNGKLIWCTKGIKGPAKQKGFIKLVN